MCAVVEDSEGEVDEEEEDAESSECCSTMQPAGGESAASSAHCRHCGCETLSRSRTWRTTTVTSDTLVGDSNSAYDSRP